MSVTNLVVKKRLHLPNIVNGLEMNFEVYAFKKQNFLQVPIKRIAIMPLTHLLNAVFFIGNICGKSSRFFEIMVFQPDFIYGVQP